MLNPSTRSSAANATGLLCKQPNLSEVNFWAPSAANVRALQPGGLFLFKLHAPQNFVGGGGVFAYADALPCSLAWEAFREANGANSAQEMHGRISRYRRTNTDNRRCAIAQERTLPAPEASHIRPNGDGGEREARNGLLLRRDIHSLFDAGYVTVTPDLQFEVSRRTKEEFDNGRHDYELHGKPIYDGPGCSSTSKSGSVALAPRACISRVRRRDGIG